MPNFDIISNQDLTNAYGTIHIGYMKKLNKFETALMVAKRFEV